MIGLNMYGRLGNQFFRYAFARFLIYKRGECDKLFIDFSGVEMMEDRSFENVLDYFHVYNYEKQSHIFSKYGSLIQKCANVWFYLFRIQVIDRIIGKSKKRYVKNNLKLRKYGIFYEKAGIIPYTSFLIKKKFLLIDGNFENPYYSNEIRDILIKEFTPKFPKLVHNTDLYNIISNKNSVCISIRRGDYLSPNGKNSFCQCNEDYFSKAIQIMRNNVPDCVFVFFSDDIKWVKANIKIDGEAYYERGDDPIWEKLRLMYSCKNFIISNSTFSWWAQFLCRDKNKVVVSPSRWFKDANYDSPLIQDDFIKILV